MKIPHIIILGHSTCGGVKASYEYFSGRDQELKENSNFVASWLEILRPSFNDLENGEEEEKIKALKMYIVSQKSYTFPFVKEALDNGSLSIHGLWQT